MDCEPITSVLKVAGDRVVKAYLESEIIRLASSWNGNPALNIKAHQVPTIADQLIEGYKFESLEDFTLCFRKGITGFYGEIYRLDGAVIGTWMGKYLDEKYDALEQQKHKQKQPEVEKHTGEVVDGAKYIKQMLDQWGVKQKGEENNAKANGYQREKLLYEPPKIDEVKKRDLHFQWIKQNHDPLSGKQLPTWISEEEWNKKLNE